MDQRSNQLLDEILKLIRFLESETQESQGYFERNDVQTTIRNLEGAKDELQTLERKYDDLLKQLKSLR